MYRASEEMAKHSGQALADSSKIVNKLETLIKEVKVVKNDRELITAKAGVQDKVAMFEFLRRNRLKVYYSFL